MKQIAYWNWLLFGSGGAPGYRSLFDSWLIVHVAIGFLFALLVPSTLKDSANTVLLPLAGVLVGLTFSWAGNAQALMQASEIEDLSKYHPGGFEHYVYTFQTTVLAILATMVFWGIAGLGVFDCVWPCASRKLAYACVKFLLFSMSSVALRECWHAVLGAQALLLIRKRIRDMRAEIPDDRS